MAAQYDCEYDEEGAALACGLLGLDLYDGYDRMVALEPGDEDEQLAHGNKGRKIIDRKGNEHRDRSRVEETIFGYSDKDLKRRFKVTKNRFRAIVEMLDPILHYCNRTNWGK